MARSEEALKRRAMKRQRTDAEQRLADRIDMRRRQEKALAGTANNHHQSSSTGPSNKQDPKSFQHDRYSGAATKYPLDKRKNPRKEFQGEKCVAPPRPYNGRRDNDGDSQHRHSQSNVKDGEDNSNKDHTKDQQPAKASPSRNEEVGTSDSRKRKNGMMDNRSRDDVRDVLPPLQNNRSSSSRHNEVTSRKLLWAPQGDPMRISRNHELRLQFHQTNGVGMDEDDIQRAKVLIARDERKKNKKKEGIRTSDPVKDTDKGVNQASGGGQQKGDEKVTPDWEDVPEKPEKEKTKKSTAEARSKRDRNYALRKLYLETGGIGMKDEQITRAKTLIDRAERKLERRTGAGRVDTSESQKKNETISQ